MMILELITEGAGWLPESPQGSADWIWLAGHHLFHVWNQEAFGSAYPGEEAFLVEGVAEYAAMLGAHELGLLDDGEWTEAVQAKAMACAEAGATPLVGAEGAPASACGVTMILAAHAWIRHLQGGRRGLADLLTGLLDRASTEDYRYTRFDFLEALRQVSGNPAPSQALGRWIEWGLGEDPPAALEELLGRAGYPLRLRPPPAAP